MPDAVLNHTGSLLGSRVELDYTLSADNGLLFSKKIAPAKNGQLTTRTDDHTGILTISPTPGYVVGNRIDVWWPGGSRRCMTIGTPDHSNFPISLGTGDPLPANLTAVTTSIGEVTQDGWNFNSGLLKSLIFQSDYPFALGFYTASHVLLQEWVFPTGGTYIFGANPNDPNIRFFPKSWFSAVEPLNRTNTTPFNGPAIFLGITGVLTGVPCLGITHVGALNGDSQVTSHWEASPNGSTGWVTIPETTLTQISVANTVTPVTFIAPQPYIRGVTVMTGDDADGDCAMSVGVSYFGLVKELRVSHPDTTASHLVTAAAIVS